MVMVARKINASSSGGAVQYLLDSIAEQGVDTTVGRLQETSPMTRYFTAEGNPPGRWIGEGVRGLGMTPGWVADTAGIENLFQHGHHPLTGDELGAGPMRRYATLEERIARATAELDPAAADYAEQLAAVVQAETRRRQFASVSGFELVFAPPKSFSTAWGLADVGMKDQLTQCHQDAMQATLEILERDYLRTRTGTDGVAQVETQGLVAAQFDHWSNRGQDPHLHTHVLVANRVQGSDGKWRTIDSRGALMPAVVTLSETYNVLLMDAVTQRLGWGWAETTPAAAHGPIEPRHRRWEIDGVPAELTAEFSARSRTVRTSLEEMVEQYRAEHGEEPSAATLNMLTERARRDTAPDKTLLSLDELTTRWRSRAEHVGLDWLQRLGPQDEEALALSSRQLLAADDLTGDRIAGIIAGTLWALDQQHAHWRRHNALTEVHRILAEVRFRSPADRDQVAQLLTDFVLEAAVQLSPEELRAAPWSFRTVDGRSVFQPAGALTYTTRTILDAEQRLLEAADAPGGPIVTEDVLVDAGELLEPLDEGQRAAVTMLATSGRQLDVLIGAAGTGKTTTLRALQGLWERSHPAGRVIGLAPSAAAAEALGDALEGIATENTAKWLFESHRNPEQWQFNRGDLVLVDEAGLAGTIALDQLREQAQQAGAKIVLIGDPLQLQAVNAGGALGLLEAHLGQDAATLTELWRFRNAWEAVATLRLRSGDTSVVDVYTEHERIQEGSEEALLERVIAAWAADLASGASSIIIAERNDLMQQLNAAAQTHLLEQGEVDHSSTVAVSHDLRAGVGDSIVARQNDRRLHSVAGAFIKNGSRWQITQVFSDGSVAAIAEDGDSIVIPADYISRHVDLGYALTAHRAQGLTVDTSHALLEDGSDRESTYVALTRGRTANTAWVVTEQPDEDDPLWQAPKTALQIFEDALRHSRVATAATTQRTVEHEAYSNLAQLTAEYDSLVSAGTAARFQDALSSNGLPDSLADLTLASPAWDSVASTLRRAESIGLQPLEALPALIQERGFGDAEDPAAVIHYRLESWLQEQGGAAAAQPHLVGLFPRAALAGVDPQFQEALVQREQAIATRVEQLRDRALQQPPAWLTNPAGVDQRMLDVVLAYRDRWGITDPDHPLGGSPAGGDVQRTQWLRARAAAAAITNTPAAAATTPAAAASAAPEVPAAPEVQLGQ